ncbi:MAG: hypothetical protein HRK26_00415 [Rickettsiaceae bacterium H1]|nr:hypothetical protein [Rickettsiaceae bacterium H1]
MNLITAHLHSLKSLDLSLCSDIKDEDLSDLAGKTPDLESIELGCAQQLTDLP